ncbi:aminotransferase class III-fold pyridoxal phosphate-dependent enzyme [Parvibaculum sp. MBR-TMA-1.3b-4.2]
MSGQVDRELRARASRVIPGGMYGHQSVGLLPPHAPQFFERAEGAYLWDVDGNRYIDFMCGYGPNLFGYCNEQVDAAYRKQMSQIDVATGPTPRMVELAEAFVAMVTHADWAMFCKNGTDASSMALLTARAYRGRKKILMASGAYHGAAPWCTPIPAGTVEEDRAHFIYYQYNDVKSLEDAVAEAGDDLAAIFASPFKHDVFVDQELPDAAYARRARELCDEKDALLIVDDIRAGFRIERNCSWNHLGVQPDLSTWGKAIANGHPISALLGNERAKEAASHIYVTGSFWFAGAAMAASLETLRLIRETDYLERTIALGDRLRAGLASIANSCGLDLSQTGPSQMPLVMVVNEDGNCDFDRSTAFADGMLAGGVYFHPFHNMFVGAAMTEADIDRTLEVAETVMKKLPDPVAA